MTAERVYTALLLLYPRRFRERYGREVLQTFTELSVSMGTHRARFWLRVLPDLARSVTREHIDEWTCGEASLAMRWVAACAIGLLIWRNVPLALAQVTQSRTLEPLAIGAGFVFVMGAAQWWALKQGLRVTSLRDNFGRFFKWSLAGGLVVAAGGALTWGVDAALNRLGLVGVGAPFSLTGHTVNFVIGTLMSGLIMGLCQAVLLVWVGGSIGRGLTSNDAARFVGWTIAALPAFKLWGAITPDLPLWVSTRWWLFFEMVVRPIARGAILGLLLVRPIATVVARGRQSVV